MWLRHELLEGDQLYICVSCYFRSSCLVEQLDCIWNNARKVDTSQNTGLIPQTSPFNLKAYVSPFSIKETQ